MEKQGYRDLLDPQTKIINHIKNKCVTIWGDFTYPVGYSNETISNEEVRQIYNRYFFKPLSLLNYTILLTIALLGLTGLIKGRKTKNKSYLFVFCELYILGTTALLLLTECNNKYTISIVPIFIIVPLMVYNNVDCSKENSMSVYSS